MFTAKKKTKKHFPFFLKKRSKLEKEYIPLLSINRCSAAPRNGGCLVQESPIAPFKGEKKKISRLWLQLNKSGQCKFVDCDKNFIVHRYSIPPRDLRILGPLFSQSSNIIARGRAILINLEFIKAIVTAEEILLLDPLCQEVLPFVDQLRQITHKGPCEINVNEECDGENELPFEFQVLEVALEVVCSYWDSNVTDLEREAYPVLDELAMKVNTKNLERVRSLKSNLTRLLARVQKVRNEIEHLLDNHGDIAHLYLSTKLLMNQQDETSLHSGASNAILRVAGLSNASIATSSCFENKDVEDLEMLLDDYFMQLSGTCNKISSVREYINDTEDYINIQLDSKRNELIRLQLITTITEFVLAIFSLIVGFLSMNIQHPIFQTTDKNLFWFAVVAIASGCFFIFDLLLVYARWKKLL